MAPGNASRKSPPGVTGRVSLAAEKRARRSRVRTLRQWTRLPGPLLIALMLHGLLAWWYWSQLQFLAPPEVVLVAQVRAEELEQTLETDPEEDPVELVEPEIVNDEPLISEVDEVSEALDLSDDTIGLGGAGLGGGGGQGLLPASTTEPGLGTVSSPFRDFVADLRRRGVDVCFVIDATGSMQRFIDRARETIDLIVEDLVTVVPQARIAVVAYRDLNDDWVTRHTRLSSNRYLVHNFLLDMEASGGKREFADFEEAVEVGLAVATTELNWREGARRVLILVGDAPYHEEDRGSTMAVVREFARDAHSLVNTVYVGVPGEGRTSAGAAAAQEAFERIAKTGHGHSFVLSLAREPPSSSATALGGYRIHHGSGDSAASPQERAGGEDAEVTVLRRQVLDATFGPRWREDIDRLLAAAPRDGRRAMARRHQQRGDVRWFSRQLLQHRLHPAIIEGARSLFDGRIAVSCLLVLQDEQAGEAMRAAALNVLKTSIADLAGLPFDVHQSLQSPESRRLLAIISERVIRIPGASQALAELRPPAAAATPPALPGPAPVDVPASGPGSTSAEHPDRSPGFSSGGG